MSTAAVALRAAIHDALVANGALTALLGDTGKAREREEAVDRG